MKWLYQQGMLREYVCSPFHGATWEGLLEMHVFLFFGKLFLAQHLLLLVVCFWRLHSVTLGTVCVCTYICRDNVYVSQNRHFLKAVTLKVKLVEPIFSVHLLTLLLCMLNRRSQIWVSLAKGPESAKGYIQSWGSLANFTIAVKKADLEKVQSFFSKVTAQKEKSLWQSREIKACACGSGKITILRLCILLSRLLHGTDLPCTKFLPFPLFLCLVMAHIPIQWWRNREFQIGKSNGKGEG